VLAKWNLATFLPALALKYFTATVTAFVLQPYEHAKTKRAWRCQRTAAR
jgi:hypothetical protein